MTLIASPHLDDGPLSAWSLLAAGARHVTVFAGVPAADVPAARWDELCGFASAREAMVARLLEERAAMETVGVTDWTTMTHLQGSHAAGDRPTTDRLAEDLAARTGPGEPLYVPLGGGPKPHPDHVLLRDAAAQLVDRQPVWLYADFPHAAKPDGWPWEQDDPHRWWGRFPAACPLMATPYPTVTVELGEEEAEAKLAGMRCYASQLDTLDKKLRSSGLVKAGHWRREHFWSLLG